MFIDTNNMANSILKQLMGYRIAREILFSGSHNYGATIHEKITPWIPPKRTH